MKTLIEMANRFLGEDVLEERKIDYRKMEPDETIEVGDYIFFRDDYSKINYRSWSKNFIGKKVSDFPEEQFFRDDWYRSLSADAKSRQDWADSGGGWD